MQFLIRTTYPVLQGGVVDSRAVAAHKTFIGAWKTTCFAGGNVLLAMPEINI